MEKMSDFNHDQPQTMAEIGVHELVIELVKKYLPKPCHIVDVGSGQGAFARLLLKEGHRVVALDIDDSKLKTPEVELRLCDFNKNFAQDVFDENEKFDAVIAIEVIEHLENPFEFVRQCRKLLKESGLLIITTPNVEAVNSRLIYLYTGRMVGFGEYETVPTGHITPIFGWKADYIMRDVGLKIIYQGYSKVSYFAGPGLKGKIGSLMVKILEKFVKGNQGGATLIIIAKLEEGAATNQK